jgi:hypothetical protein
MWILKDTAFLHSLELVMDLHLGYIIPEMLAESGIVCVSEFLSLNEYAISCLEYEEIPGVGYIQRLKQIVATSIYVVVQFVCSNVILSNGTINEG